MKRFWDKVEKTKSCWVWQAGCTSDGYGAFWFSGRTLPAHVISWRLTHGEDSIPHGLVLDHICRNTKCVNPEHLRVCSNAENILWGVSPSAINKRRTHCKNGHELSGDNLDKRLLSQGKRICRICQIARKRAWRERHPDAVQRERERVRISSMIRYSQLRDEINAKRRADRASNPEKYDKERARCREYYRMRLLNKP